MIGPLYEGQPHIWAGRVVQQTQGDADVNVCIGGTLQKPDWERHIQRALQDKLVPAILDQAAGDNLRITIL